MIFAFLEPGSLESVNSRSKADLRMTSVDSVHEKQPMIVNVNLAVSQVSRVAVIGANGANKSAAIKVLVGEQLPTSGSIGKQRFKCAFASRTRLSTSS